VQRLPAAGACRWGEPQSRVTVTSIHSAHLKKDQKLWVYTPVGFRISTDSRKLQQMDVKRQYSIGAAPQEKLGVVR
jgi:hypothetical protein